MTDPHCEACAVFTSQLQEENAKLYEKLSKLEFKCDLLEKRLQDERSREKDELRDKYESALRKIAIREDEKCRRPKGNRWCPDDGPQCSSCVASRALSHLLDPYAVRRMRKRGEL